MKFKDFIVLSQAISKLNVKEFVRELNVKLEADYELMKKEYVGEELKKEWAKERQQISGIEAIIFIGENLFKIEEEVKTVIKNNTEKKNEEIENMEHDEIINVFKNSIFKNGVPEGLIDKMGLGGLDLKKTL